MDHKARMIAKEFIDNDKETDALYSDARLILALHRKKELSLNDILKLMQVRRAQRYRRLGELRKREFIKLYLDPNPEDGLRKRKKFVKLTGLGKRVARILNSDEHFKKFRVVIPDDHVTPTPYKKPIYIEPEPEPEIPLRKTIFEVIDDEEDEFIDDEVESVEEEFIEEDEAFKMEDFIDTLKRGTKNG